MSGSPTHPVETWTLISLQTLPSVSVNGTTHQIPIGQARDRGFWAKSFHSLAAHPKHLPNYTALPPTEHFRLPTFPLSSGMAANPWAWAARFLVLAVGGPVLSAAVTVLLGTEVLLVGRWLFRHVEPRNCPSRTHEAAQGWRAACTGDSAFSLAWAWVLCSGGHHGGGEEAGHSCSSSAGSWAIPQGDKRSEHPPAL